MKRLTETKNNEFGPSWSPDGKHDRLLGPQAADHLVRDEHGGHARLDARRRDRRATRARRGDRQPPGPPQWSPDGKSLYFTVQSRGSVGLYRLPDAGGAAERLGPALETRGSVERVRGRRRTAWSSPR